MATLLLGASLCFVKPVVAHPAEIIVPDNHEKIQWAISNASIGDTVFVRAGTYYENLVIDKSLKLIGKDKITTIIDANGTGYGIRVKANNVYVNGFTIQNGQYYDGIYLDMTHGTVINGNIIKNNLIGIYMYFCTSNTIINNLITRNQHGIRLYSSSRNIIADNTITLTIFYGISPYGGSSKNTIYGNTISNNTYFGSVGIYIGDDADPNNIFYHNNFINNTIHVVAGNQTNAWDNSAEGNYWSNHTGTDLDGNGIGETPYIINANNMDNYPLIKPWSPLRTFKVVWEEVTYYITIHSNNTVASFNFSQQLKQISFKVTGPLGAEGLCLVTIPKNLLWVRPGMPWLVMVDTDNVTPMCTISENDTHAFISIPVTFSTRKVTIIGTGVVPEFPTGFLPLLAIVCLVSVLLRRKLALKRKKKDAVF